MSRAALWKQEANVQERERQATDAFLEAIEAGKVSKGAKKIVHGVFMKRLTHIVLSPSKHLLRTIESRD